MDSVEMGRHHVAFPTSNLQLNLELAQHGIIDH
jgi:hypothetical protein